MRRRATLHIVALYLLVFADALLEEVGLALRENAEGAMSDWRARGQRRCLAGEHSLTWSEIISIHSNGFFTLYTLA